MLKCNILKNKNVKKNFYIYLLDYHFFVSLHPVTLNRNALEYRN